MEHNGAYSAFENDGFVCAPLHNFGLKRQMKSVCAIRGVCITLYSELLGCFDKGSRTMARLTLGGEANLKYAIPWCCMHSTSSGRCAADPIITGLTCH